MPRDRKAIEARKQRERQDEEKEEELLSWCNDYGYPDPTAYMAIQNIMLEEKQKKRAAHGERGRQF